MPDHPAIRCLVVDDEPPARELISRYIAELPHLVLAGECGNALQAIALLQQQPVDLMFLDIRMPQLNGNELLKTLKHPPKVIFTTAYPEYALEGYELDITDYLLKPIPFERFLKAVNKAFPHGQPATSPSIKPAEKSQEAFVYFRADRKMVKVMLDDIIYIESMKDYVRIFTSKGTIISKQSLTAVEDMLPDTAFARVHRSFIVSLKNIRSYTAELIETGNTSIPIGKLYRHEVMKLLQ